MRDPKQEYIDGIREMMLALKQEWGRDLEHQKARIKELRPLNPGAADRFIASADQLIMCLRGLDNILAIRI
jgi:hypothetical protein